MWGKCVHGYVWPLRRVRKGDELSSEGHLDDPHLSRGQRTTNGLAGAFYLETAATRCDGMEFWDATTSARVPASK